MVFFQLGGYNYSRGINYARQQHICRRMINPRTYPRVHVSVCVTLWIFSDLLTSSSWGSFTWLICPGHKSSPMGQSEASVRILANKTMHLWLRAVTFRVTLPFLQRAAGVAVGESTRDGWFVTGEADVGSIALNTKNEVSSAIRTYVHTCTRELTENTQPLKSVAVRICIRNWIARKRKS